MLLNADITGRVGYHCVDRILLLPYMRGGTVAEFDAYLMVDCSASSRPVMGKDSIWYCLITRSSNGLSVVERENPSTRRQAMAEINVILRELANREQMVLVGFDFPLG